MGVRGLNLLGEELGKALLEKPKAGRRFSVFIVFVFDLLPIYPTKNSKGGWKRCECPTHTHTPCVLSNF